MEEPPRPSGRAQDAAYLETLAEADLNSSALATDREKLMTDPRISQAVTRILKKTKVELAECTIERAHQMMGRPKTSIGSNKLWSPPATPWIC